MLGGFFGRKDGESDSDRSESRPRFPWLTTPTKRVGISNLSESSHHEPKVLDDEEEEWRNKASALLGGSYTPRKRPKPKPEEKTSTVINRKKRVLMLLTSEPKDRFQRMQQGRALAMLRQDGVLVEVVDLDEPRAKELLRISKLNDDFPQIFLTDPDGKSVFFGNFEMMEGMHEAGMLGMALGAEPVFEKADVSPSPSQTSQSQASQMQSHSSRDETSENSSQSDDDDHQDEGALRDEPNTTYGFEYPKTPEDQIQPELFAKKYAEGNIPAVAQLNDSMPFLVSEQQPYQSPMDSYQSPMGSYQADDEPSSALGNFDTPSSRTEEFNADGSFSFRRKERRSPLETSPVNSPESSPTQTVGSGFKFKRRTKRADLVTSFHAGETPTGPFQAFARSSHRSSMSSTDVPSSPDKISERSDHSLGFIDGEEPSETDDQMLQNSFSNSFSESNTSDFERSPNKSRKSLSRIEDNEDEASEHSYKDDGPSQEHQLENESKQGKEYNWEQEHDYEQYDKGYYDDPTSPRRSSRSLVDTAQKLDREELYSDHSQNQDDIETYNDGADQRPPDEAASIGSTHSRHSDHYDTSRSSRGSVRKTLISHKVLVVVVTEGKRWQLRKQERSKGFLEEFGLDYEVIDEKSERRDELLDISLLNRQFPQFFLEASNGTVSFFGTYENLEEIPDAIVKRMVEEAEQEEEKPQHGTSDVTEDEEHDDSSYEDLDENDSESDGFDELQQELDDLNRLEDMNSGYGPLAEKEEEDDEEKIADNSETHVVEDTKDNEFQPPTSHDGEDEGEIDDSAHEEDVGLIDDENDSGSSEDYSTGSRPEEEEEYILSLTGSEHSRSVHSVSEGLSENDAEEDEEGWQEMHDSFEDYPPDKDEMQRDTENETIIDHTGTTSRQIESDEIRTKTEMRSKENLPDSFDELREENAQEQRELQLEEEFGVLGESPIRVATKRRSDVMVFDDDSSSSQPSSKSRDILELLGSSKVASQGLSGLRNQDSEIALVSAKEIVENASRRSPIDEDIQDSPPPNQDRDDAVETNPEHPVDAANRRISDQIQDFEEELNKSRQNFFLANTSGEVIMKDDEEDMIPSLPEQQPIREARGSSLNNSGSWTKWFGEKPSQFSDDERGENDEAVEDNSKSGTSTSKNSAPSNSSSRSMRSGKSSRSHASNQEIERNESERALSVSSDRSGQTASSSKKSRRSNASPVSAQFQQGRPVDAPEIALSLRSDESDGSGENPSSNPANDESESYESESETSSQLDAEITALENELAAEKHRLSKLRGDLAEAGFDSTQTDDHSEGLSDMIRDLEEQLERDKFIDEEEGGEMGEYETDSDLEPDIEGLSTEIKEAERSSRAEESEMAARSYLFGGTTKKKFEETLSEPREEGKEVDQDTVDTVGQEPEASPGRTKRAKEHKSKPLKAFKKEKKVAKPVADDRNAVDPLGVDEITDPTPLHPKANVESKKGPFLGRKIKKKSRLGLKALLTRRAKALRRQTPEVTNPTSKPVKTGEPLLGKPSDKADKDPNPQSSVKDLEAEILRLKGVAKTMLDSFQVDLNKGKDAALESRKQTESEASVRRMRFFGPSQRKQEEKQRRLVQKLQQDLWEERLKVQTLGQKLRRLDPEAIESIPPLDPVEPKAFYDDGRQYFGGKSKSRELKYRHYPSDPPSSILSDSSSYENRRRRHRSSRHRHHHRNRDRSSSNQRRRHHRDPQHQHRSKRSGRKRDKNKANVGALYDWVPDEWANFTAYVMGLDKRLNPRNL